MSRRPKPFFRKQTQSWYFSTGGKQINLGKERDSALATFHRPTTFDSPDGSSIMLMEFGG
ncbi:MAG: hypothetical protein AAFU85_29875 [Planctomycetota bacterium]